MDVQTQDLKAQRLLGAGCSDEDIERLTGVPLIRLIELRGIAACSRPEPTRRRPSQDIYRR